jgi:pimeloyl-ACP methyl ester carboxylesterase
MLRDRFRCVALDLRAHGRSERPVNGDFDWHGFAADVLAVVDRLGLDSPAGFGHSCGGATLLLAEQARPGTFDALYCYEPIVRPADAPLAPNLEGNPLSRGALRRRNVFASREEALANFSAKAPFDRFRPDVLAAYVDNGFAPEPGGGISLRCRRDDEALVYAHGFSHNAFTQLSTVGCPVTLACGAETDNFGPDFLALLAGRLVRSTTLALPGLRHFGPLEDPATVARSVSASLADRGDPTDTETLRG